MMLQNVFKTVFFLQWNNSTEKYLMPLEIINFALCDQNNIGFSGMNGANRVTSGEKEGVGEKGKCKNTIF